MLGSIIALTIVLAPMPEAPYVSCPGGYIAPALADCPYVPVQGRRAFPYQDPPVGGGPHRRGLLGLGGVGGIL